MFPCLLPNRVQSFLSWWLLSLHLSLLPALSLIGGKEFAIFSMLCILIIIRAELLARKAAEMEELAAPQLVKPTVKERLVQEMLRCVVTIQINI